jgi:hypothetical protein
MYVILNHFKYINNGHFDTLTDNTKRTIKTIDILIFKGPVQGQCHHTSLYNRDTQTSPELLILGRQCMRTDHKINERVSTCDLFNF